MKPHVLITDKIHDDGILVLDNAGFDVTLGYDYSNDDIRYMMDIVDAIIVRTETHVDEYMIERGAKKRLKIIGRAGVGLDNIDTETAERCGILVVNTPEANVQSAAEHTMGMMLALSRHIPQATGGTRQGRWERNRFMGVELAEKHLSIIGLGRVGSRVAKFAKAFGMEIHGYDPYNHNWKNIDHWHEDIINAVHCADFVTIHTPLNDETRGMINDWLFHQMKPGVRLINCARGPLVNQQDLIKYLDNGTVAGYACDVFENEPVKTAEHPFYKRRNCIVTPHIGAMTYEAQKRVSIEICTKIRNFINDITNCYSS